MEVHWKNCAGVWTSWGIAIQEQDVLAELCGDLKTGMVKDVSEVHGA